MRTSPVLRAAGGAALLLCVGHVASGGGGDAGPKDEHTTVTIWRMPAAAVAYAAQYGYGGYGYGSTPGNAAFVSHRRSVDVTADGELRFPGVSTKIDPSTVQFRSLTDAKGTAVVEQRFAYDLGSTDKLIGQFIGKQVTVTTAHGDVTGTLRSVDAEALVLETGTGASRAVDILRRGENLLDVKLAAGDGGLATVPTLVWKVVSKKPGKQSVEVSYRTDGLTWDADYTAILDPKQSAIELSAWATITNDTGVALDDAELNLVTGVLDNQQPQPAYGGYVAPAPKIEPSTFTVPRPVTIASGGTVQVELMPTKANVSSRRIVVYETIADMSPSYQTYPYQDCYSYSQPANTGGHGETDLEVDSPDKSTILPEGHVRIFQRKGDELELLGEDALKVNADTGHARLRLGTDDSITGSRRQLECLYDDRTRTVREKFEITVENKSKDAAEVVLKEYMYRWINWRMDAEDLPGTKVANQTQEYRVKLGGNGKKTFTYTVIYAL